jgi:AhpD family alkylhydroperoxidase
MRLPPRTREAIALRVAELNGCDYCLAAHTAFFDSLGEEPETIRLFCQGLSADPKEQTLLALSTKLVVDRGHHTRLAVEAAREVGVRDEEIVEVVALVALYTFVNYLNSLAQTEIDFPTADHSERLIADQERPQDGEPERSQEG